MNRMHRTYFLFFVFSYFGWQIMGSAQTVPVGQMDDTLRNLQLIGKLDPNQSFTVRPYYIPKSSADSLGKTKPRFVILPSILTTKFNSHHPYGWNDQGMLAAKGLQTELTAGIYARYGSLGVQLQPQFVYAANPDFEHNSDYGAPTTGTYVKLFPGQSSIRLHAGPVSIGVSSENLWWGPGQYSSLLMSNNTPGFVHFTLNTTRPITTPIGSFEFQIIGGKLEEDSAAGMLYENFHLQPMHFVNEWRYLSGMVVAYQPSFLKGVFIGMTRSFQLYNSDIQLQSSFIEKYIPVFTALLKSSTDNEDAKARDQTISLFMRWLLQKANAEFYFEYGWNDHKANTRDLMLDPTHAASYIVGGKKLVPLRRVGDWLELNAEITQMAQSPNYVIRDAGNWYIHGQIAQGMTHQNQILGAGSGLGNNVQTFSTSWLHGSKKLGLLFQKIQHDPGALAGSFNSAFLREVAWTETAIGAQGRWNFDKIIASLDLHYTWSRNYGWEPNNGKGNLYGLLKIAYTW